MAVLVLFLGALVLTQVFWYNFAPLVSLLAARYGISELTAGWTILVFPLASLVFSGHAGSVIDRRGYRFSIRAGLTLMAVSAALRIFDGSFWMLLLGQAGAAISVPYIVTCISTLVADQFDAGREAFYTGVCTMGIFVGMAVSLAGSPILVQVLHFRGAMLFLAAITAVCALAFQFTSGRAGTERAAIPPASGAGVSWASLFRNRNLAVIFVTGFIGQGCFNALTTWMEPIWHERGFPSDAAGIAGGLVIAGGIAGSLLIPPLLDKWNHPRLLLWICLAPSMLLVTRFLWADGPRQGYAWGAALGFLWLPSLAITLTLIERTAHKEHAGAASGLFWTIGNAGVLGLTVLFELLKEATNWRTSIYVLVLMLAVLNASIAWLRPTDMGTAPRDVQLKAAPVTEPATTRDS